MGIVLWEVSQVRIDFDQLDLHLFDSYPKKKYQRVIMGLEFEHKR